MANFNEVYLGISWITATLSNDTTMVELAPGGFYRGAVPPTFENNAMQVPVVIMAHQGGPGDVTTVNAFRVFDDLLYQVVAAGPQSVIDTVAQAAAWLDRLLGGPPNLPVSGPIQAPANSGATGVVGAVLDCHRQQPLVLDLEENGERWVKIGGLYNLKLQQFAT
jgi:hypothetical protein